MEALPVSLLAVFLTGLLGGVHCIGMCGGILSTLAMLQQPSSYRRIPIQVEGRRQPSPSPTGHNVHSPYSQLTIVLLYNLGRIGTYVFLGALAGGVGSVAWLMDSLFPIQQAAFVVANVLMILMGLYVVGYKRIGLFAESVGKKLWVYVRPQATRRLASKGALNMVLAGSLWGLVPCGLIYAILSVALVSGGMQQGALLLFVFGLGTLPNLLALGLSGQWLVKFVQRRWVRTGAGCFIICFGFSGLYGVLVSRL